MLQLQVKPVISFLVNRFYKLMMNDVERWLEMSRHDRTKNDDSSHSLMALMVQIEKVVEGKSVMIDDYDFVEAVAVMTLKMMEVEFRQLWSHVERSEELSMIWLVMSGG